MTPLVECSVESSTNSRHLSSGGWFQALSSTPSILPNAWCGYAPARAPTPVREQTHTTTHTRSKVQTSEDLACYAKPCVAAFASECLRCCGARKSNVRRAGEAGQASEPRRPARTISGHRESLQLCSELRGVMHPVIQKRQPASGSLPKASKVRKKVPGLARAGAPPGEPATVADASIKDTSVRDIRLIHLRGRPAVRKPARASQGRTPGHGRRRAREHPSSSHAHGNGAQARAEGTA